LAFIPGLDHGINWICGLRQTEHDSEYDGILDLNHHGEPEASKLSKTPKQGNKNADSFLTLKDNDNASMDALSDVKYREQLSQISKRDEKTSHLFSKRRSDFD